MSHNLIDECIARLDDRLLLLRLRTRTALDLMDLRDMLLDEVARLVPCHDRTRKDIEQRLCTLAAAPRRLNGGHAERLFELRRVDLDAAPLRIVLHIEINEERNPLLKELYRKEKIALDVRAVHDIQDEIQLRARQVVDDDLFLRRAGVDAVRPRKVDNGNRPPLVMRVTNFLVNRDPRPVSDFLTRTCQCVEYGRFTGIWVSGQCNCQF